jgi:hypothetical protein
MTNQQDYQSTVNSYVEQLRSLFHVPEAMIDRGSASRGGGELPAEQLVERAEKLAETSQEFGHLTANYLESDDLSIREAAEMKMLSQAIAEVEIARRLFEVARDETGEKIPGEVTRSSRGAAMQRSIEDLIGILERPLEAGIAVSGDGQRRGAADPPTDLERARAELQAEVKSSLKLITNQTSKVGGRAVSSLLLMDAALLVQGVSVVSKDLGEWIDKLISGASAAAKRLAQSAFRLLLQAYDWVLELLGKEIEETCRKQVKEWIDELKAGGAEESEGVFEVLLNRIYTPDAIKADVSNWLAATSAEVAVINRTSDAVGELAAKYRAKTDTIDKLLKGIAFAQKAPFVNTPQGQLIIAAITLSVLGYTIYLGYDHVDSGRLNFYNRFGVNIPDRVEGVRETVQKFLC